jgi:hypothetical protein
VQPGDLGPANRLGVLGFQQDHPWDAASAHVREHRGGPLQFGPHLVGPRREQRRRLAGGQQGQVRQAGHEDRILLRDDPHVFADERVEQGRSGRGEGVHGALRPGAATARFDRLDQAGPYQAADRVVQGAAAQPHHGADVPLAQEGLHLVRVAGPVAEQRQHGHRDRRVERPHVVPPQSDPINRVRL